MDYAARLVWYSYQRLSEGEKSCLAQMLGRTGAQQLTSADSTHGEFYRVLESFAMAQRVGSDDEIARAGVETWELTDAGRDLVPVILARGFAKIEAVANESRTVRRTAFRFVLAYAAVQLLGGLLAYGLALNGFDISATAGFNLLLLTVLSCQSGLWLALRARLPKTDFDLARRTELLKLIAQRRGRYSLAIMMAAFAFHLPVEIAHEQLRGVSPTALPFVKTLISAGIAALWCYFALPYEVDAAFSKIRKELGLTDKIEEEEEPLPL